MRKCIQVWEEGGSTIPRPTPSSGGGEGASQKILAQTPVTVDTKHSNPPSLNFTMYITSIINSMLPHQLRRLNELLIVYDSHMKLSSERGMSALPMLIMLYDTQRSK